MNPKTVAILVVCLAFAGVAYVLTQRSGAVPGPDGTNDETEITNAEPSLLSEDILGSTLTSITFDSGVHGKLLELERIQGRWWVTKPSRFKADPAAMDELLTKLSGLTGRPAVERLVGLVPDSPRLFLSHGLQQTQLFFNSRLGAGRAAVTVVQDSVTTDYNATDTLHDLFDTLEIERFYANAFDPPLMPEVGRIDISTPDGNSSLIQDGGRWWIMHEAGLERALETGLPGYPGLQDLFELFQAKLIEKQSDNPANGMASYGLSDPLISARFVTHGQDPEQAYEVHIGTAADPDDKTRYVSNGSLGQATNPVFTMATEFALAFGQDATVFRDPRIMATPWSLVGTIELKVRDGKTETIQRQSDGVWRGKLSSGVFVLDRVDSVLQRITEARATEHAPIQASWERQTTVTITPRLDGEIEVFSIYTDPQSTIEAPSVLVHRGKEPVALRVSLSSVAALLNPSTLLAEDAE